MRQQSAPFWPKLILWLALVGAGYALHWYQAPQENPCTLRRVAQESIWPW